MVITFICLLLIVFPPIFGVGFTLYWRGYRRGRQEEREAWLNANPATVSVESSLPLEKTP